MKLKDIQPFTRWGSYRINVPWSMLEFHLNSYDKDYGLDLDPDFQRAHVWTEEQQIRYIEFKLREGKSGSEILFNCPGFNRQDLSQTMVLVDGKQRLEAVRRFVADEIPAFGLLLSEYEEGELYPFKPDFIFYINDLETRAEMLQWYLDINAGGVVHSDEEIEKVRKLLAQETQ